MVKKTNGKLDETTIGASCPLGPPDWRYRCKQCKHVFLMPAPKGPSEEKNRKCTKCGSAEIERIDLVTSEVCPPGG
ncbi:MAG: hypothetical protein JW845_01380 [Dehalococcoidales bacterium]|nr:hypothetical protein [Dehalococcoidales bacterium]